MCTQAEAIRLAIKALGGQAALARDLDVKPPTVAGWALPNTDPKFRPIPARYCLRLSALSGVHVKYLRPNDWMQLWPSAEHGAMGDVSTAEGAPSVAAERGEVVNG